MTPRRKLIETALPLDVISQTAVRSGGKRVYPFALHRWWARQPLAAARAVLWASLVDDPSARPDRFPSREDRILERKRLFGILERLIEWEDTGDPAAPAEARAEIERSCGGAGLPAVADPFCGGGTIPLEGQRLGLRVYGGDLNPIAALISKALVEIPPRFWRSGAVNPGAPAVSAAGPRPGAQGLADDIGFYSDWMLRQARKRIGRLYPKAALPAVLGGGEADVGAWIWAHTIKSPDPSWNGHVPLVRSWLLRKEKRNKPAVWIEPVPDRESRTFSYRIREGGEPPPRTIRRGVGICAATGAVITNRYIKAEGRAGNIGRQLTAIAVEGRRGRVYLPASNRHAAAAECGPPEWYPSGPIDSSAISPPSYGLDDWHKLFTDRQLTALSTFGGLLGEVRPVIEADARRAGLTDDGIRLRDGGAGAAAYADAVVTYLAFAVNRCANRWACVTKWDPQGEKAAGVFIQQGISMSWDFAEANPFSESAVGWSSQAAAVRRAVTAAPGGVSGDIRQEDASARLRELPPSVVCTAPPYYGNIQYADISDFFYVWLRRRLSGVWPEECATLLTPKAAELVANPRRAGSKAAARRHFEKGMAKVLERIAEVQHPGYPAVVFYTYRQQEIERGNGALTPWEIFLQALTDAGMQITAAWPIRTQNPNRLRAYRSAALSSSVVVACRPRPANAPVSTRRQFLDALAAELPEAVRRLVDLEAAPVDLAQSAAGPGLEIFTRCSKVLEADGAPMSIRTALELIHEALERALSAEETELDAETRWAVVWYRQYGYEPGPYGDAEVAAAAMLTSVDGIARAGVAESREGRVRLLKPEELNRDWNPAADKRLTVWKATQHLIALLDHSESGAARLLRQLGGGRGGQARQLAYLLHQISHRRGRHQEALAYNALVQAWLTLSRRQTS